MKDHEVTHADISTMMTGMADRPIIANRTLACVRKMFNLADLWGYQPDGSNPCRHIQKARLQATRWPDAVAGDWSRGQPTAFIRELATQWEEYLGWRSHEAVLNEWPQFTVEIDGVEVIDTIEIRIMGKDRAAL